MRRILSSLIQSDFGDAHGNLEAVILEGDRLRPPRRSSSFAVHWWRDSTDAPFPWNRGQVIVQGAAAAGSIIQSDFRSGDHGNFEVVVPLFASDGTLELWHFWHDNSDMNLPWYPGARIATNVAGPGSIIQSDLGSGDHGNFEVVVPVGGSLVHFGHDNSDMNLPWRRRQNITDSARGWGSIIQSDIGIGAKKNFEVLVEECSQSVVAYWHPNQDENFPWIRHSVLIGEPYPPRVTGTRKIVQLIGEYDRQGWNGQGTPPFAFNRTESSFCIRGTDLGASFEHNNAILFLFGDTWRVGQTPQEKDLDAVAFSTDTDASNGLTLTFNPQPPFVPGIRQDTFNVPLDGVSWNGAMYVFFSTDHLQVDMQVEQGHRYTWDLMGRSVLARSTDGGNNFDLLYEFSRSKFINVSVESRRLDQQDAAALGMPEGTMVLWIWGADDIGRAMSIFQSCL
jgi:uncharacterized protein DUF4185